MLRLVPLGLLLGTLAQTPVARADLTGDVNVLSVWIRQPGQFSDDQNPSRGKVVAVDPYRLAKKLETRALFDVQYGEKGTYRGLPLRQVVRAKTSEGVDRVILHFANGMRIPVSLADLGLNDVFLAVESCDAKGRDCAVSFPKAARSDVYAIDDDPSPISFSWNKLVVGRPWHPVTGRVDSSAFSPWRHADTLIGLELVDGRAYDRQFAVGDSGGERIFLQRCQFCHGVRYVGSSFGWDVVFPLALHEKRDPANLLNHVKYPKAMAQKLGLQMPPQKDVEGSEIKRLWNWMRDVSARRLRPYRP